MKYTSEQMEQQGVLQVAAAMCAAARTAPKAVGKDVLETVVLTGQEKQALVEQMLEIAHRDFEPTSPWYLRDADNVQNADALVLIGADPTVYRGLSNCSCCGFENCSACQQAGGVCAYVHIDLGIAVGSAVTLAANAGIDNRIMFSAGKAAAEMGYTPTPMLWQGIPLSVKGKNIFFDRKVNR